MQAERPIGQMAEPSPPPPPGAMASLGVGGGQSGPEHTQRMRLRSQACPAGHMVPVPQAGPSGQTLAMGTPQNTLAKLSGGGHRWMQMQRPRAGSQRSPTAQPSVHRPPQPSSWPHERSVPQRGTQSQANDTGSQVANGFSQGPTQRPPQPSSSPQRDVAVQVRLQVQRPITQRSRGERLQGVAQAQVSTQPPSRQSDPGAHDTPAQRLGTQRPSAQTSLLAHVTASQGVRGVHVM